MNERGVVTHTLADHVLPDAQWQRRTELREERAVRLVDGLLGVDDKAVEIEDDSAEGVHHTNQYTARE